MGASPLSNHWQAPLATLCGVALGDVGLDAHARTTSPREQDDDEDAGEVGGSLLSDAAPGSSGSGVAK